MNHLGSLTLETERLVLRKVTLEDARFAFKNWVIDERVTKFLTWQPHASVNETEKVFGAWVEKYARPDFYQWVIVPKDLGEPIGTISGIRPNDEEKIIEIGYCIGYDFWGKGYTAEALKKVLAFLMDDVGYETIYAKHASANPNSGKVMQKAGMNYKWMKEKADVVNCGAIDVVCYEIKK